MTLLERQRIVSVAFIILTITLLSCLVESRKGVKIKWARVGESCVHRSHKPGIKPRVVIFCPPGTRCDGDRCTCQDLADRTKIATMKVKKFKRKRRKYKWVCKKVDSDY